MGEREPKKPRLYTREAAAEFLDIKLTKFNQIKHEITGRKIGRQVKYLEADLIEYLERTKVTPCQSRSENLIGKRKIPYSKGRVHQNGSMTSSSKAKGLEAALALTVKS